MITPNARIALHVAEASTYRPPAAPPPRVPKVWTWWMTGAMLVIATVILAIGAWQLTRWGMR